VRSDGGNLRPFRAPAINRLPRPRQPGGLTRPRRGLSALAPGCMQPANTTPTPSPGAVRARRPVRCAAAAAPSARPGRARRRRRATVPAPGRAVFRPTGTPAPPAPLSKACRSPLSSGGPTST